MNGGYDNEVPIGEMARAGTADGQPGRRPQEAEGRAQRAKRSPLRAPLGAFFATDSAKHALALMDQAVVSGSSFLTTILIGRWCGASELGIYSLGFSLLVSWGCVHQSLIALPYTIYRHRTRQGKQEEYAGSALVHNGLLSALALVALAVAALVLSVGGTVAGLATVLGALAGVIPFALLREFSRRFAFAHLRMAQALVFDLAVAAVQLLGLAWLASTGALSASTAYLAFGVGCALTGAVWLYLDRSRFVIRRNNVWHTLQQSWSLGRWLFASQVTVWVQAYFIHWLLACLMGPTATGVYAACMTVVMFSNPLLLGISNALAPRAAQAFAEGGSPRLRRVIFQTTVLLGAAMALFCAVVFLAGEEIMAVLYHGLQYEGHGNTVAVLALAMLASALGMPASNGLAAAERPDLTCRAGLVAVALVVVLVPCLVLKWGVGGAAYGFLAGTMVGSLGRWAGFLAVLRRRGGERRPDPRNSVPCWSEADAATVVARSGDGAAKGLEESNGWVIERLNEGAQASIFAVRRRDGQPFWQTHEKVAVKLFRPTASSEPRQQMEVVRRQFTSLAQFHAKLNGSSIQGWRIHSPIPLYQCEKPLALVMTLVPGRSLNSLLETGGHVTPEILESIAEAVSAALERYWWLPHPTLSPGAGGEGRVRGSDAPIHGDLNFDNILCDVDARTLAFVDSGVVEDALLCDGVSRDWYPASRDLAYLLFDTTVSVKQTLGLPTLRRRQDALLEGVLRACLRRIKPVGNQESLLNEIQACARVQLKRLQVSWSPRGIWRLFLRRIASRRIDRILGKLRGEIGRSSDGGPGKEQEG